MLETISDVQDQKCAEQYTMENKIFKRTRKLYRCKIKSLTITSKCDTAKRIT